MPPTPTTQRMGELHERHVAEVLGWEKTRGSGSGRDKGDGAHHHDDPFAFRGDCKSTKARQLAVTLDMISKIREQAGGERPAIPLRWYGNEALTSVLEDWIAVTLLDFSELLQAAHDGLDYAAKCAQALQERDEAQDQLEHLREELGLLRAEMQPLRTRLAQAEEQRVTQELTRPAADGAPAVPAYVPMLPWTVIIFMSTPDDPDRNSLSGTFFDAKGHRSVFGVSTVRVERSSNGRPRLMVNDRRVANGDLYVDGVLTARVCPSSALEVG